MTNITEIMYYSLTLTGHYCLCHCLISSVISNNVRILSQVVFGSTSAELPVGERVSDCDRGPHL